MYNYPIVQEDSSIPMSVIIVDNGNRLGFMWSSDHWDRVTKMACIYCQNDAELIYVDSHGTGHPVCKRHYEIQLLKR